MAVVAAPQRLAGVERGAVAQRHEGVLQLRAAARVGVHVAARHARHPEAPGERLERAVARAIVAGVGALQLHAQAMRAEGVQQPPRGGLVVHAVDGAAGEAHQPLAVLPHRLQAHRRLAPLAAPGPLARVGVRAVSSRQRLRQPRASRTSSVRWRPSARSISAPWSARIPQVASRLGKLHRARHRVVVGQRQRLVAELPRPLRQLVRQRGSVQEGVGRVAVQLDVCTAPPPQPAWANHSPEQRSWKTTRLRPRALTISQ